MSKRQHIDNYFLEICNLIGTRGTCDRGRAGCIIVRDKQILSTGYVGSPKGMKHCDEIGHELVSINGKDHCIRTTHAEQNAICQAAKNGINLDGATLYCKMTPCYTCAKMIVNAGIIRVVAGNDYHDSFNSNVLFRQAKIKFKLLDKQVLKYEKNK